MKKLSIEVLNGRFSSSNGLNVKTFSDHHIDANGWAIDYNDGGKGDIVCQTNAVNKDGIIVNIRYTISPDGFARLTRNIHGKIELIKKGFVIKKGQPLYGTLYLAEDGAESYGYFHPYTILNYMVENNLHAIIREDPNQIFFLKGNTTKVVTDGSVNKRAPLNSYGSYAYEIKDAEWAITVEDGVRTIHTMHEPSVLDLSNSAIY